MFCKLLLKSNLIADKGFTTCYRFHLLNLGEYPLRVTEYHLLNSVL